MAPKKKQRATRTMYMHTIDGWPAKFTGREIIGAGKRVKLASSLKQIREEQARDAATMARRAWSPQYALGYVRVEVPANAR